jgi:anti-sigma factor RsiW
MTCNELLELLVDYLGGELVAEHHETVTVHISGCARCASYVATYEHTVRIARALPKGGPLPPAFEARLRQALEPELAQNDECPTNDPPAVK